MRVQFTDLTRFRLAVLLTCHNRRETTLASVRRLFEQELPQNTDLTAFVVDDGSTDGTSEALRKEFPQVRLLHGNGNLYWSGGMRWAFAEALDEDFDYYFWLNDDTFLCPDALARLVATHHELAERGEDRSIIVGSLRDPDCGHITYGGVIRSSRIHPLKFRLLPPADKPLSCEAFNGNAVLLPRSVTRIAGNISSPFTHGLGDFDYGLRARKLGCFLWISPGFVGTCRRNGTENTFFDSGLPWGERMRKMLNTKGLPPREYGCFARMHGGIFWPVFWVLPYIRITLQSLLPASKVSRSCAELFRSK